MEYFAGLDVLMEETHICVIDREGALIREEKTRSSPAAIAAFLADGPPCEQVVFFETGRMAPMLHHGLVEHGIRIVCIESRQAYQALKSLAGHNLRHKPKEVQRTHINRLENKIGLLRTFIWLNQSRRARRT